jgi:hypothetical protein
MMINNEYETFQLTQLNNNIKDSKILIYLLPIPIPIPIPIGYNLPINRFNGIII